ncbi:hypothetical protein EIK77_000817 [Talaromyces pinophilus]|nr:hypothetical protein EIK77_005453 [Talaromyces pinophilus]KAI7975022.1 hypothetical protein EIK77_000817 [Talaromyces pinophilus]
MPKASESNDPLATARCEDADERIIHNMANLATRLGFASPRIDQILQQSPDRHLARAALLKAREPSCYRYESLEALVTRITECFDEAVPVNSQPERRHFAPRTVPLRTRCGKPRLQDHEEEQNLLFLDQIHTEMAADSVVSAFYVRQCVYFAFFGKTSVTPHVRGDVTPQSPLFVPVSSQQRAIRQCRSSILSDSRRSSHAREDAEQIKQPQPNQERRARRSPRRAVGSPLLPNLCFVIRIIAKPTETLTPIPQISMARGFLEELYNRSDQWVGFYDTYKPPSDEDDAQLISDRLRHIICNEPLNYLTPGDIQAHLELFQERPTMNDLHKDASEGPEEYQDRISRLTSWPNRETQSDVRWIYRASTGLTSLKSVAKEDLPLARIIYRYFWICLRGGFYLGREAQAYNPSGPSDRDFYFQQGEILIRYVIGQWKSGRTLGAIRGDAPMQDGVRPSEKLSESGML